ncbi:unnamed protein product, partial [Ectocarpus sp. 8 AP-2014]
MRESVRADKGRNDDTAINENPVHRTASVPKHPVPHEFRPGVCINACVQSNSENLIFSVSCFLSQNCQAITPPLPPAGVAVPHKSTKTPYLPRRSREGYHCTHPP